MTFSVKDDSHKSWSLVRHFLPGLEHGKLLFVTAIPMAATSLILNSSMFFTMIFIGQLDDSRYIGAATLGSMICNISGQPLAISMCSALDTLVSQAFGSKMYHLMGLYCQRTMIILTIGGLFVGYIWYNTEYLLINVVQINREMATLSGHWSRILIIGLWPTLMFEVLKKFLQCQAVIWPVVWSAIISTVTNYITNYVLILYLNKSFSNCAYSYVISQWIAFLSLSIIIIIRKHIHYNQQYKLINQKKENNTCSNISVRSNYGTLVDPLVENHFVYNYANNDYMLTDDEDSSDPEDNWPPLSYKIFRGWKIIFSLGIPGAVSLGIEWYV